MRRRSEAGFLEEGKLLFFALAVSLLGTAALLVLSKTFSPEEISLNELSFDDVGKLVSVQGAVSKISFRNGNVFITLCSRDCLNAVVFSNLAKNMKGIDLERIRTGQFIRFAGALREYNGELEIVAAGTDSVEILR